MTPQQHALAKLKIAIETGRWEFVQEAYGILDGSTNEEPRPMAIRHPWRFRQRGRAA